jgi:23S rRNA (guanosine2251-2'-O)-methyltransferase
MIIIAHNIRSLHNVGSIFRTADVFGIEKIYLTGYTGHPPRKEIAKTALGSDKRVEWEGVEDVVQVIDQLKESGVTVAALEMSDRSVSINSFDSTKNIALILGNEVEGIEKEVLEKCDEIFEIDMPGNKKSLNVSVAAGIGMFVLNGKNVKI